MTVSRRRSDLTLGFRKQAEVVSHSWRGRLGATPRCRLDTAALATAIGLPLVALSEFARTEPRAAYRLYITDQSAFSATAVCDATRALGIVYNDGHEPPRQRADIAHECAHIILQHTPTRVFDDTGRRVYPESLEAEANWLGPTLLVPRAGLIDVLRKDARLEAAAEHFDVSVPLVRFVYSTRGCSRFARLAA